MSSGRQPRVLVTRAPHQASELADRLRELGAEPILIPAIELAEPTSYAALDEALARLESFDWMLFTSANAVEAFVRRGEGRAERVPLVGAIGAATARALEAAGMTANLVPARAVAEAFAAELMAHARQADGRPTRFLLVRAEEARDVVPEALRGAGAEVTIAPAYRTVVAEGSIAAIQRLLGEGGEPPEAATFTSSSSARNLLALCEAAGVRMPASVLVASIGPVTSATLRELGYPPGIEAESASVEALAQAVAKELGLV